MKKSLIYLISLGLILVANPSATALAQQAATSTQSTSTVALPPPGLTPDSPFYFLNQFMENMQRFFTFNPEAKARLEIKFAAERISEINAVITSKGVQDSAVKVAESSLKDSLNRAAQIVASEKAKGNDVSQLASSLDNEIGQNKDLLTQTFENQKDSLDKQIEDLKAQLSAARAAGDTAKIDALTKQIQDLKAQKDLLDSEKHSQEDAIDDENNKVEDQLGGKGEAMKKIQEMKDKKVEVVTQFQGEGVTIPDGTFTAFDSFMAQAQSAFDAGNYGEAISSSRQANRTLNGIERTLENLKEATDNQDEVNSDLQGLQQEAAKAQSEQAREAVKKAREQLREDQKDAQEQIKRVQEQMFEQQKKSQEDAQKALEETRQGTSSESQSSQDQKED